MTPAAMDVAAELGHEELQLFRLPGAGLHAVIAIHDTTLGPAVGGTRMRLYPSLEAAVNDALRLSQAMTYQAALAGIDRGGGAAVIVGDPAKQKSRAVLTAFAKAVDELAGRLDTGCDMGIDSRDAAFLARLTRHVSPDDPGGTLGGAELTALGVFESIRTAARLLDRPLQGLRVAVQGLGQVGYRVARRLSEAGARLWAADLSALRSDRAASELGAEVVAPDDIYEAEVDVFSPNAGGGVLDEVSIGRLRCAAVVGGASVPLAEPRHAALLREREILYAPDTVVGAGGLLTLLRETGQLDEDDLLDRVRGIGDRFREIALRARTDGCSPAEIADRMAERRLSEHREAERQRRQRA